MTASPPRLALSPKLRGILRQALRSLVQSGGTLMGVCGVAVLWAGLLHSLSVERKQALRSAVQDTSNLSRAFEENIVRSIKAIDQSLLYIRDSYEKDPAGFNIAAWTRSTQALTDMTFQISSIDKDGLMRASNLAAAGDRVDLSDREHFRVHRDRPADKLFISKPVMGRVSRRWSMQITRKMLAADGSFDGVVVMSLDPGYLSRFYDSVDLGSQGEVTLVGADGVVRAGARGRRIATTQDRLSDDAAVGQSLADGRLLAEYAKRPAGAYDATSAVDGVKRVTAYRAVRGTTLIVAVGIAEDDVLKANYANWRSYFVLAALLTILLLFFSVLIVVRQARLNRTQAQLAASRQSFADKSQTLEITLEHISQGIIMIDADLRVQVCNRRAQEMLALPGALLPSRPHLTEVLQQQLACGQFRRDGQSLDPWVQAVLRSGVIPAEASTYESARPDGSVLEICTIPMSNGGAVRTFTDITARNQAELVLRVARDDADRTTRAKSEFLATMSHEIRSPMSGLLGVLDLLRGSDLNADQTRMAEMVHNSGTALLAVLNDILDFSKIEAGAMHVTPEPTRLRDLITKLVQPYAVTAAGKGVNLRLELSEEVPNCAVVDPLRLRQILNNLLSNATKFTSTGTIGLQVDVTPTGSAPKLRFAVSDTGMGMADDVLDRLFGPFMQADGSTSRNFGGTGLGLCIAKRMARLLDGDLAATSEQGQGSVFTLSLPLIPAADAEVIGDASAGTGSHRWAFRGRVLVADDDVTNRWFIQRQLELLGLNVAVTEDGLAAFVELEAGHYDLLVTDCHMPRIDGVALTCMIRASADPVLRALPIIGLTADVTSVQLKRCQDAGMTEVAIKPLNLQGLASLVSRHLTGAFDVVVATLAPETHEISAQPATYDDTIYHELFPMHDPEGAESLAAYLDAADGMLRTIEQSLEPRADRALDRTGLALVAHRLAGSSLSVGATALGEQARSLEDQAATADLVALEQAQAALAREFAAARQAITVFRSAVLMEARP